MTDEERVLVQKSWIAQKGRYYDSTFIGKAEILIPAVYSSSNRKSKNTKLAEENNKDIIFFSLLVFLKQDTIWLFIFGTGAGIEEIRALRKAGNKWVTYLTKPVVSY